jgi:cytidylate kinase
MTERITVAIDGPAGSGKSTIARLLARRLGYVYVDTGAMYRTVTLAALRRGLDPASAGPESLAKVAREALIELEATPDGLRVSLDGQRVGESIRTPEIASLTSRYTANSAGVREELVRRQREMGRRGGVVMEGRDITTVVFPDAQLKVYLDCSVEERVRRRSRQFTQQGIAFDAAGLASEIERRDDEDRNRPIGALKQALGAVKVLSDGKQPDEIVDEIMERLPQAVRPD